MVQSAVPSRTQARRFFGAMRRRTAGGLNRLQERTPGRSVGRADLATRRGLSPNGDPPSVTLWGED